MVNFKPMNDDMLWVMDKLITKENIKGPFLDVGGGIGDISMHLANMGFSGMYVDFSKEAIGKAKKFIMSKNVVVKHGDILKIKKKFNLILILDVLEHVPNDREILQHLHKLLNKNGFIFVSVPIRMKEWTWLDNELGHLRRYEIREIINILASEKFKIINVVDYSFPFFWLMKKIYTKIYNPKKLISKNDTEKTKLSSVRNYKFFNKYLRSKLIWYWIWRINHIFRNNYMGIQVLILARK